MIADPHAADLAQRVRAEDPIAPARLRHVLGDEVAGEAPAPLAVTEQLAHAGEAVDELPVRGEDVHAELVGRPQHVLAPAPQRGGRALQRVAAVEHERARRPLGPHPLDQRGQVRVAAHPSVARGQGGEVHRGERVGARAARRDPVVREQRRAGQIRRLAALAADAEQRVGLAIVDGPQRGVRVGQVQQRDVAERLELEQPLGRLVGLDQRSGLNPAAAASPASFNRSRRVTSISGSGPAGQRRGDAATRLSGGCPARSSACRCRTDVR